MGHYSQLLIHSCCPGKTDIVAPEFELTDAMQTKLGYLFTWSCKGCKTEVIVGERYEDKDEPKVDANQT
jgi:hypothetical protein